jgi:hypothetical protein
MFWLYICNYVAIAHFINVKQNFHINQTTTWYTIHYDVYTIWCMKNVEKWTHRWFRKIYNLHNKCFIKQTWDNFKGFHPIHIPIQPFLG